MRAAYEMLLRALKTATRPGVVRVAVPLMLPGERNSTEDESGRRLYAALPALEGAGVWRTDLMIGYGVIYLFPSPLTFALATIGPLRLRGSDMQDPPTPTTRSRRALKDLRVLIAPQLLGKVLGVGLISQVLHVNAAVLPLGTEVGGYGATAILTLPSQSALSFAKTCTRQKSCLFCNMTADPIRKCEFA